MASNPEMARLARLESFDLQPDPGPPAPGEDWVAGQKAGIAEGRRAAMAEQGALREDTAQALAELAMTHREAQNNVLARLAPLFDTLVDRLVPHVLRATFGAALVEALNGAAEQDARTEITLHVAPADLEGVRQTCALLAGGFRILPDERLAAGQVLLDHPGGGSALDFLRLAEELSAALAALGDDSRRREHHG